MARWAIRATLPRQTEIDEERGCRNRFHTMRAAWRNWFLWRLVGRRPRGRPAPQPWFGWTSGRRLAVRKHSPTVTKGVPRLSVIIAWVTEAWRRVWAWVYYWGIVCLREAIPGGRGVIKRGRGDVIVTNEIYFYTCTCILYKECPDIILLTYGTTWFQYQSKTFQKFHLLLLTKITLFRSIMTLNAIEKTATAVNRAL